MIDIEEAIVSEVIVHRVGSRDSRSVFSTNSFVPTIDDEQDPLKKVFLRHFASQTETLQFVHDVSLDYNVTFNLAKDIFHAGNFVENSAEIAKFLSTHSNHPSINDGDLFVVRIEDIKLGNTFFDAVAVLKFETDEIFIRSEQKENQFSLSYSSGLGGKKPEKGCLIVFTDEPYTVFVTEQNSQTEYWRQAFLGVEPKDDDTNRTSQFLSLTKDYLTSEFKKEFSPTRDTQIDLINRSYGYFKDNTAFDRQTFEKTILNDREVIDSFREFERKSLSDSNLRIGDQFDISAEAVKKQSRIFKSVLKLDRNFHVYIHGDRKQIERGVDPDGRKFYKLYFDTER